VYTVNDSFKLSELLETKMSQKKQRKSLQHLVQKINSLVKDAFKLIEMKDTFKFIEMKDTFKFIEMKDTFKFIEMKVTLNALKD
jgi:hypothetical protein